MIEEQQHDELDFISTFRKNNREIAKIKTDFASFMDAGMISMRSIANILLTENTHTLVVGEMKKIDLKSATQIQIARIQFLINELSEEGVVDYKTYLNSTYSIDDIKEEINKLQEQAKEIRKDNPKAIIPKEMIAEFDGHKALIAVIESISDSIAGVLTSEIYGDLSLDDRNMPGVFFKFKNLESEYHEMFIREVRRIRSNTTDLIRKISVSTNSTDNSLTTVLIFFDNDDDTMSFYAAKTLLEGVYDKYTRLSEGANATGEFDIIHHKFAEYINVNLPADNPLSGMYIDPNAPAVPVSPTRVDEDMENPMDMHERYQDDDAFAEYKPSNFVFIADAEGEAFYITPKEYWRSENCVYDQHIEIDHLLPAGFDQAAESYFLYSGNFDDGRELLIQIGMKEVSFDSEEGEDLTVYPEDALFGIITSEDTLGFKFVARERYLNQIEVYEGDLFFDGVDDADVWSIADDNLWEYKDGSPVYLKEALDYLLAIGMTHEQELDMLKEVDDVADKINTVIADKVAVANQIEEDLKTFVATQFDKVTSWKRNPADFSIYWSGSEWKLIMTSELEDEAVRGTLTELKSQFETHSITVDSDLSVFIASEYEKVKRWKKNPAKFSVYKTETGFKCKETSKITNEDVVGILSNLNVK
jgi:hypothetical protein